MHLIRDILDKQIVDRDEHKMGRVDGIVARLRAGEPPVIESVELGWITVAKRLHPRIGQWVEAAHDRFSVRRTKRYHVKWEQVTDLTVHHVQVDLCVDETPAADWEHWLREHIIEKIPGSKSESESDEK
jgi:hypothetical protein